MTARTCFSCLSESVASRADEGVNVRANEGWLETKEEICTAIAYIAVRNAYPKTDGGKPQIFSRRFCGMSKVHLWDRPKKIKRRRRGRRHEQGQVDRRRSLRVGHRYVIVGKGNCFVALANISFNWCADFGTHGKPPTTVWIRCVVVSRRQLASREGCTLRHCDSVSSTNRVAMPVCSLRIRKEAIAAHVIAAIAAHVIAA